MIAMTIYVMIARVRRNRGSMPTGGRRSERAWQLEAKQDQRADYERHANQVRPEHSGRVDREAIGHV